MGTRVVVAVANPIISEDDIILWCNTTSFDVLEQTEQFVKDSKSLDEVLLKIKDFKSYSTLRGQNEQYFGVDSKDDFGNQFEYPFGDYEYVVYVDRDLTISKLSKKVYSTICGKSLEELENYNYGREG